MIYKYKQVLNPMTLQISQGMILRLPDGATIPCDPDNTDYQAYLAWVAEGNVADPAEEAE